jgi:hypothetical protein
MHDTPLKSTTDEQASVLSITREKLRISLKRQGALIRYVNLLQAREQTLKEEEHSQSSEISRLIRYINHLENRLSNLIERA